MKTTMSQGEKSIDARLYCGSTFGDDAEATIEIKAKGIHHTDLAPLISSAPELLEACKVALRLDYVFEHPMIAEVLKKAIAKAEGHEKEGAK